MIIVDRPDHLEPFDLAAEPAPAPPANRAAVLRDDLLPPLPGEANRGPVPAQPLHLCPTCDYNLTGLVSRRCPECGQPFTLREARMRNIEKSMDSVVYLHSLRYERHKQIAGMILILLSLWAANFDPSLGLRGWLGLIVSGKFLFMLVLLTSLMIILMLVRFSQGLSITTSIWPVGLVMALLGALALVL